VLAQLLLHVTSGLNGLQPFFAEIEMNKRIQKGFTLIELMIVVAVVGVLAAIALPSYQEYLKKSRFSEVVSATTSVKAAVNACIADRLNLADCDGGSYGIPANVTAAVGNLATLNTTNGVITATAVGATITSTNLAAAVNGLEGQTYILTPTRNVTTGQVTWAKTGTCTTVAPPIC
jgi:type IV pilus assembly protein PilA